MKKIVSTALVLVVIGCFVTAQAQVLTDRQLDGVYAGEFETAITEDIIADSSTVGSQKNIAVIGSADGAIRNNRIRNDNDLRLENVGDSAVAIQSNMGAIAGMGEGQTRANSIRNRNDARIENTAVGPGLVDGLSDKAVDGGVGSASDTQTVSSTQSAVSLQSNIAAIVGGGTVRNNLIDNDNSSRVDNLGDSAISLQSNVAAIAGLGAGENRGNRILNSNIARVDNEAVTEGSVEATMDELITSGEGLEESSIDISATQSAVAIQNNIAAIAAEGSIRNNRIRNTNRADVDNIGDSAVTLQSNIAAISGFGEGVNSGNTITNSNIARVDNEVATIGNVDATSSGLTTSGAGSNSAFTQLTSFQSAVASQSNIGAIIAAGSVTGSTINNSNRAFVNNQ